MAEISQRSFILRRIHSLTGLVPVGLFLMNHMFINAYATRGAELYNQRAEFLASLPMVWVIEALFIFIPLIYHALYGLIITATGQPNNVTYPYGRNWNYLLQRISGVILVVFITWHVVQTKVWALGQGMLAGGHPDFFARMVELLANSWMAAFYVLGLASAIYHFANGMWNFCITWGITVSRRSQQRATWVWSLFGLALFGYGLSSLIALMGNWPGVTIH